MHLSLIRFAPLGVSLALIPTVTSFSLIYGKLVTANSTGNTFNVVSNPSNPCNFVFLGPDGQKPCGVEFVLEAFPGLTLEGCGNGLFLNQNGEFFGNCESTSGPIACIGGFTLEKQFMCGESSEVAFGSE